MLSFRHSPFWTQLQNLSIPEFQLLLYVGSVFTDFVSVTVWSKYMYIVWILYRNEFWHHRFFCYNFYYIYEDIIFFLAIVFCKFVYYYFLINIMVRPLTHGSINIWFLFLGIIPKNHYQLQNVLHKTSSIMRNNKIFDKIKLAI